MRDWMKTLANKKKFLKIFKKLIYTFKKFNYNWYIKTNNNNKTKNKNLNVACINNSIGLKMKLYVEFIKSDLECGAYRSFLDIALANSTA